MHHSCSLRLILDVSSFPSSSDLESDEHNSTDERKIKNVYITVIFNDLFKIFSIYFSFVKNVII
jgi:hypothetical protein